MRIPESLFPLVNMIVRALLRSPLHGLMSSSVMVIHYRGRKSGRALATPVRYLAANGTIRCTTADYVQWWRNVQAEPGVMLRVAGELVACRGRVLERDPVVLEPLLREFLEVYPQDAVYQDIRLNDDGSLNESDVSAALQKLVIVEFDRV